MPTLPVIKTAYPGKEAPGGQRSLSLLRLRLSVQPAARTNPFILNAARPFILSPELVEGSKDAAPQRGYGIRLLRKPLTGQPEDGAGSILRQAQDERLWREQDDVASPPVTLSLSKGLSQPQPVILSLSKDAGPRLDELMACPPPDSPVAFAREVLGVELWHKQVEVLTALTERRRVAVKSGNGLGKGFCAAVAVLWFVHTRPDAIVLTTAPTFRQVRHILWRQIRRLYGPAAETLGGKMLDTRWELPDGRYAMGLSADGADQFQGFHSPNVFIVVDEAEGVGDEIYEAIESVMTSAEPLLLLIGNPTTMTGAFRRAFFEERRIYRNITISALDSPNVQAGRVVIPGLTTPRWVEERREIWGEDNPVYRARVLGEFPDQGDNTLLNLSDIEAAVRRPHSLAAGGRPHPNPLPWGEGTLPAGPELVEGPSVHPSTSSGRTDSLSLEGEGWGEGEIPAADHSPLPAAEKVILGVDVARFGADRSVILRRRGDRVEDIRVLRQMDTMQLARWVAAAIRECSPAQVYVDEIGVGAGVVDRLRELGHPVRGVNVAHKARQDGLYLNLRAEGYWTLRQRFMSGSISIPADNQLVGELAALRYGYDSQGRLRMESKDEMRKRGLPSPDKADALMLAFLAPGSRMQLWT